jgi:beta-glucosidase
MKSPYDEAATGGGHDIDALVAAMTLDEKAALTAGVDNWHTAAIGRLGIPAVKMTDGPNGARGSTGSDHLSSTPSVCIPSGSALGATWDPEVVGAASAAVARQARQKHARVLLAPTVNLHRHPLWGRSFECFSEDPYLSGKLAAAYIVGAQAEGVMATVKHLVCNETEHERRMCSSEVEERALRELYLLPFEMAVREGGVQAVMTSYNRLNGGYLADNAYLLTTVLRGEWGFDGIVMTDWWAVASTEEAAEAGLDIEMPGPGRSFGPALARAVNEGRVKEQFVDEKAHRLLTSFDRVGAFEDPPEGPEQPGDHPRDREVARRAAIEAMVLLKNDGLLPLDLGAVRKVALIGPGAEKLAIMGGGSARVRSHYDLSLLEALSQRLGPEVEVTFATGCRLARGKDGAGAGGGPGASIGEAAETARGSDVAIVVVGTNDFWESESYDRTSMDLPGEQEELVERVLEANSRTVVVLNTGSPVTVPFAGRAASLVQCWFGGQELANALVDVLVGDAEPGGRLPVTLPQRIQHTPAFGRFPGEASQVRYGEGILVGYRWYEARQLPVSFPFGHGLSFTTTRIGPVRAGQRRLGRGGRVTIEVDVENIGSRPGAEVVQLYVAPPGGGELAPGGRLRPVKQLKGFAKVRLAPGESTTVQLELTERSFAYWDVADTAWPELLERNEGTDRDGSANALHRGEAGWYVDAGTYEIQVGRSSADISGRAEIEVEGSPEPLGPTPPPG